METTTSSAGERVVSFVLMIWALGWVARFRSVAPDDLVALGVTGLLGVGGLAASVAVWRATQGAIRVYAVWAIADVIGLVYLDTRVEPVWWRVVVGGLVVAAVLGVFGLGLAAASHRRRLSSV